MRIRRYLLAISLSIAAAQGAVAQKDDAFNVDPARLFDEHCSVCHGDNGDGRSRASANLSPRPRDFTAPQSAAELTRERMIQAIREGRPGTAMAPWKSRFSDAQIAGLSDYIRRRFMVATAYDESNEGRRIYAEFCSVCHGDRGNGMSRAARSLDPPPRDFTSAIARRELTRERMIFGVTYGRANTAMAPWNTQLSAKQMEAVVEYVRETFMGAGGASSIARNGGDRVRVNQGPPPVEPQRGANPHAFPGNDPESHFAQPFPQGLVGHRDSGLALYLANCVPCHGVKGDGQGPRAYFILPRPRDFGHPSARASFNRPRLFEAISKGKLGSEMPAWEKVLTPQQIADIGEHVLHTYIRADASHATPANVPR